MVLLCKINLSQGSIAKEVKDDILAERIINLARIVCKEINLRFWSVDIIQTTNDDSYRCEIKCIEEGWTPNSLGKFEGTVFKDYETIVYLLRGNWLNEIYMTDPEGNNRVDLLKLDEEQEYIKNNVDSYVIPQYSCRLNQITPELEKILPKNDSKWYKNSERKTAFGIVLSKTS